MLVSAKLDYALYSRVSITITLKGSNAIIKIKNKKVFQKTRVPVMEYEFL